MDVRSERPFVPQPQSVLVEIFDLALDLIVIVGFDGCFKRVNPAFERTLGYPLRELLSRPFLEVIHPEDLPWLRNMFDEFVCGDRDDVIGVEHASSVATARCAGFSRTRGSYPSEASSSPLAGT
jgi:PAS domain-containing protein